MAESADKRTSKAWQYFTDLKQNKAKCNFCGRILSYKGGSPYNLIRHTKSQHPGGFQFSAAPTRTLDETHRIIASSSDQTRHINSTTDTEPIIASSSTTPTSALPTTACTLTSASVPSTAFRPVHKNALTNYFTKPLPAKKSEQLNRYLIQLISKNYLPFSIVDSDSFRRFVHELNPNYNIPCRKTISNALLLNYYNIEKERISKCLQEADYVAITTDSWTSKPNENYISLTAHFLNKSTELKSYMLDCRQYSDRHTAENLKAEILNMCEEWNINSKIVSVTSDNAANLKAAIKLLKWKQIPCFAHTLNLIVQTGLKEIKTVQTKMKSIVELFKRSPLAAQRLQSMQKQLGDKQLKLKQDVVTRWNSTFEMFHRILETKTSLMSTIAVEYPEMDNINNADLDVITHACKVLSLFKDVTEEMSSESKVTISQVILISNALKKKCRMFLSDETLPDTVKRMTQVLLDELTSRFHNVEDNNIFAESTLLDPRFKKFGFSNEFSYARACSNLKSLVSNLSLHTPLQSEVVEAVEEPPVKRVCTIWEDFDRQVGEVIKNTNPTAAGIVEVDRFLQEPLVPRHSDPFKWWHHKKDAYPRLYEVVKKRMCISD